MTEQKHIIWSSDPDYEDWRGDLEEQYPELSEQERMELMVEQNNDYLDDERCNLNIQLSRPILLIADIGRWDGRYPGYAEIKSGNIRDCLYSEMDYSTWYVDRLGDLRCDAVHHDGTNHYLYRAYKENVSEAQMLLSYDGAANEFRMVLKGKLSHTAVLGADAGGNVTRIDNALEKITEHLANARSQLAHTTEQLENARTEMTAPFPKEAELAEKTRRLNELNVLLNLNEQDRPVMADEPDEGDRIRPKNAERER